jgi:hypothetical protein
MWHGEPIGTIWSHDGHPQAQRSTRCAISTRQAMAMPITAGRLSRSGQVEHRVLVLMTAIERPRSGAGTPDQGLTEKEPRLWETLLISQLSRQNQIATTSRPCGWTWVAGSAARAWTRPS